MSLICIQPSASLGTPVQHHCFLFLVAISNLSNEFRCVHGLQLVASPSTPKSSPHTSNLASSFSQKSTAWLDRPAAYPLVIVLPPVACVFSSIHGTSQTHHVAFGFHGVLHRELHEHKGVTELSTKGFVLLVKRCGDCPSLRLTGTRCQFSPCAGEEHGEGLGKSLLNRVLHVEAHAEKCGRCKGQLSPCGGRRPLHVRTRSEVWEAAQDGWSVRRTFRPGIRAAGIEKRRSSVPFIFSSRVSNQRHS